MTQILQSFAQRGVGIGFEGPKLIHCRLRKGESTRLEYLIPAFSDDQGTYVIPLKELPNVIDLSTHDHTLHTYLCDIRKISPLTIRDTVDQMHLHGGAGSAKASEARRRRSASEMRETMNYCFLIIQALREISPDTLDFDLSELITETGHAKAKAGFHAYANANNTNASEIMETLKRWSKIISPIGMRAVNKPGILGQDLARLQAMTIDLKKYLEGQTSEVQLMGRTVIEASQRSSKIVLNEIERIWACEGSVNLVLKDSDRILQRIEDKIEQIAWILDGWQKLLDDWNGAKQKDQADKRAVVKMISENLPQMPAELGFAEQRLGFSDRRRSTGGQVRANIDWRTNRPDNEMVSRLTPRPAAQQK